MTDNPSEETAPAQPNPPDGAESQTVGLTGSEPGKPSAAANEPPAAVGAASSAARFRILRPHAKGGLGEVSVAEDEELHREVALKEVQRRYADNPAMRTRFLVEAEITGGLEHPGIVPVYGLGQYPDGRPFYAMRFIRGNSLKQAIAQFHDTEELFGGLAFRQLLGRFVDVCNAMAYAHSRGVLHRDLKPGNIMLGKFGETLVVDWGLAKVRGQEAGGRGQNAGSSQEGGASAEPSLQPPSLSATDETMEGTAIGTTVFMSPEQAAGRLDLVGPASDIYSLGATLYVLLTGRTPFPSGNTIDNLRNVQAGAFPPPRRIKPAIPAPLEAICLKAMAREPQDRYAGALDLAADVEHWLADEPVSAWPEPVSVRLGRWMRKHKPLVSGVAAALVVGMVAATAGAIWYEREQAERAAQAARQAAERELRQEHVNKEIRFALDEADQKRADLQLKLEDPGQVYELLSDIDLWQARLQAARSAWKHAQSMKSASPDLVDTAQTRHLAELDHALAADEKDLSLARDLDNVRLEASTLVDGKFDYGRAAKGYPAAFAKAGLGMQSSMPSELADRIARSPIRYALVASLDHWAGVSSDPALRERLLEVARKADPHPWRDRFRDAKAWDDLAALKRLAGEFKPEDQSPQVVLALAARLHAKGSEPVALLRGAIMQHPRDFWLHFDLGNFSADPKEKIGCFQAALAVRPRSSPAHINLGNVLRNRKDPKGAALHYAKAIELDPGSRMGYLSLGNARFDQKDIDGAIAAFKKAIDIDPDYGMAHYNLGTVLRANHDLDGAIKHLTKAVELEPNYPLAHNNLGNALFKKRDLDGAVKHLRKATELDPDSAMLHYNLGNVLRDRKELGDAITEYRAALKIDPNHINAHGALGRALLEAGEFAESRKATAQFLLLAPKNHPARPSGLEQLKRCDNCLALDRKLGDYLAGKSAPGPAEQIALADLCRRYKGYHAAAVELYAAAFSTQPALADDLTRRHREHAARSALLAAAGEGRDAQKLDAAARTKHRAQALAWLKADFDQLAKQVDSSKAEVILLQLERLTSWESDLGLATVRDPKQLADLPDAEQTGWRTLWMESGQLLNQIRARIEETTFAGVLTDKQRSRTHEVKFEVGKTYVIDMHSTDLDSYLKLFDAKGTMLAEDDDVAPDNLDARLIYVPTQDSALRVVATSFQESGRGTYQLTIRAIRVSPK